MYLFQRTKFLCIALVLFLITAIHAHSFASNQIELIIAQAEYLNATKQYSEAVTLLEQAIEKTENKTDTLLFYKKLGAIAEEKEDYSKAFSAYSNLYQMSSTKESAVELIHVSLMLDDNITAQNLLDTWLADFSNNPTLLYYQGLLFCYQSQFDTAKPFLQKAINQESPIKQHAQKILDEINTHLIKNDTTVAIFEPVQKPVSHWEFGYDFSGAMQADSNAAMIPASLMSFYETNTSSTSLGYRSVLQISIDLAYSISSHLQWYIEPSMYSAVHFNEREALSQFDIYSPSLSTGFLYKKSSSDFGVSAHYRDIFTQNLHTHFSSETAINLFISRQYSQRLSLHTYYVFAHRNFSDESSLTKSINNQDAFAHTLSLSPILTNGRFSTSFELGTEWNQSEGENYQFLSFFSNPGTRLDFSHGFSLFANIQLSYKHYYHYVSDEQLNTRKDIFFGIHLGLDYQLNEYTLIAASYTLQDNRDIKETESPYAYQRHLESISIEYRY